MIEKKHTINHDDPRKIEEYYIAYVDLLGYKDFFEKHADRVLYFLKTLEHAIANAKDYVSKINFSNIMLAHADMDIKYKIFSDNILLCLRTGNKQIEIIRLLTFLSLVADIQRSFATEYNLFLRGGITIGEMFINGDFVFGKGLIDVVEMESQAKYPRIIVSDTICEKVFKRHFIFDNELQRCLETFQEKSISDDESRLLEEKQGLIQMEHFSSLWKYDLVIQDSDGTNILNYLYYVKLTDLIPENSLHSVIDFLKSNYKEDYSNIFDCYDFEANLKLHKENIESKLVEYGNYEDIQNSKDAELREKILKKYMWSVKFHNFISQRNNFPQYMIYPKANCDGIYMTMNISIDENIKSLQLNGEDK